MDDSQFAAPSDRFLVAVGALALNWAVTEAMLDFAVAIIFNEYPYRNMDPEVPQNLGRKLRFIRRGLNHPQLTEIRNPATALLDDLKTHKDDRNSIVHGAIMGAPQGDQIESLRISYGKNGHDTSVHTVTSDEVEGFARTALDLSGRATAFVIRLFNLTRPDKAIDYPFGEFAG
jgi:hypothetical protein